MGDDGIRLAGRISPTSDLSNYLTAAGHAFMRRRASPA
jgi:hypothetical protein